MSQSKYTIHSFFENIIWNTISAANGMVWWSEGEVVGQVWTTAYVKIFGKQINYEHADN